MTWLNVRDVVTVTPKEFLAKEAKNVAFVEALATLNRQRKQKQIKKSEEPPETQTISIPLYCRCTICGQEEKVLLCEEKLYTDSHNWDNGTERPPETTIQVWQCFPEKTVCYCNNKRFELVVKFPKEK